MKLGNFFDSDSFTLTQSPHGVNQGFQAFDIIKNSGNVGTLIAQADGEVKFSKNLGKLSYFNFNLQDGSFIQYVHALPSKLGKFKKGDVLGRTTWHHYHIGLWVKNVGWQRIIEYMDRNLKINNGNLSIYWGRWSTYADKNLNINDSNMQEWNEFLKWNDAIGEKGLTADKITFNESEKDSKLVNKTDGISGEQKGLLLELQNITRFIQENNLQNTSWVDTVLKRYALYVARSKAV